jgi:cytochrome P450
LTSGEQVTGVDGAPTLDRRRLRELFDLRGEEHTNSGAGYEDDPYPIWHGLREKAPVHEGTVHDLTGYHAALTFHGLPYPGRPHFSTFTHALCDRAYRDDSLFASAPGAVDPVHGELVTLNSMLSMGGTQHRRYRTLVQPSFVPAKAQWWVNNWVDRIVHQVIDAFIDDGRADLNLDFCACVPVLIITGSFGIPVEQALDLRASLTTPSEMVGIVAPIVAARRESPQDDLISVLVQSELTDEDGTRHRLTDAEVFSFALLLLAAGSGTTWRQMGMTLAALLQRPHVLEAVRRDRELLRGAIEESLRWTPTNPMFSRWVTADTDFYGTRLPKGSVLHICLGAANRDPARWERPDDYDIARPAKPSLAFGGGPHVCLGMHVARSTMQVGISALLDRLPNLSLDSGADPPRFIGMYHRGVTAIPVAFG